MVGAWERGSVGSVEGKWMTWEHRERRERTPYVYDKKFLTFGESLEFLNFNSIKSFSNFSIV